MRFTPPSKACLAFLLVAAALAIRVFALNFFADSLLNDRIGDPDGYGRISENLARHNEYSIEKGASTAYRPPGYVIAILGTRIQTRPNLGVVIVHSLFLIVMMAATYALASRFVGGPPAVLACCLVGVDPVLVRQSAVLMNETLFAALLTVSLAALVNVDRQPRIAPLAAGLFIGLAALTRPIAIPAWLLIGVASMIAKRPKPWLIASVVAFLVYLPWPIRNYQIFGAPIITTTHGGYTLWLGMNPVYYRDVVSGPHEIWPEESFQAWTKDNAAATKGMNEMEADAYFRSKAIEWMRGNPTQVARAVLHHVWSFWTPMPHIGSIWQRRAVAVFYSVVFVLSGIGIIRGRAWRWPASMLLACILAFTLVHAVYWSNVRMRAPLAPVIATLAALAFVPRQPRG